MESLAAVVTEFNAPLKLEKLPLPDLEEGAALVKVDAATLCGTDVHYWQGDLIAPQSLPYVPGHETVGIVADMKGKCLDIMGNQLQVGDRIIAAYPTCGQCYYCSVANQPNLCPSMMAFGRQRADQPPYLLGGVSQYHYIPARCERIRVPEGVPSPLAASAACALRTVIHGFERTGAISSHETVVVQGAGPLGLYATALARDRGAKRVLVIGAPKDRLAVAKAWGADDTFDLDTQGDAARRREWVQEHTSGRGADIVVECAASAAIPESFDLVRRGGRVAVIGLNSTAYTVPGPVLAQKAITVLGVIGSIGRHFYQALEFLDSRKDQFPFERLITGSYTLDQINTAMTAMADFREVKPVIRPSAS